MPFKFEHAAELANMILGDGADTVSRATVRQKKLVRAVRATHAGQPVAEVEAELRRRFAEHGIAPQEPAFGEAVQAIAACRRR